MPNRTTKTEPHMCELAKLLQRTSQTSAEKLGKFSAVNRKSLLCIMTPPAVHLPKWRRLFAQLHAWGWQAENCLKQWIYLFSSLCDCSHRLMLRMRPSYLARLTAEPLKRVRYCSSVRFLQSSGVISNKASEGWKAGSWVGCASTNCGVARKQRSQP